MRVFDYLFAFLGSLQCVSYLSKAMLANMRIRTGTTAFQCLTAHRVATSVEAQCMTSCLLDVSSSRTSISAHASFLVHLLDKSVDVLLSVTQIAALDVMLELPRSETASGVTQLEWPQEVTCLFEVRSDGGNLVDQVFHTDDAELAQVVLDQLVVGEGDALLVDLAIAALVDEFTDGLKVRVPVGDVRVNDGEHLLGGFSEADEDAVI
jgi:hypothetical protein